ncbi:MAG: dUTP diphosphatase, partial [Microthrixaceae bacterium]|nr:dUTP diphosphatase [Microthrixaceae bacterium]
LRWGMQIPDAYFKRLDPNAQLPVYQTQTAAGLDLAVCLPRGDFTAPGVIIEPIHKGGSILKLPCGFACAIPVGFEGQVRPRSGLATKHGITIPNAPGTVDSDYRGEMFVALINLGNEPFTIRHGDRVAQLVIAPVAYIRTHEVDDLDVTARGAGGFGSTGGHGFR